MSDSRSLLQKLGLEPPNGVATAPPPSTSDAEEGACAAFGYLRGLRDRALHVEFRLANGNSHAFPYSWLGPVSVNPSVGVTLYFVGDRTYRVAIRGRNLDAPVAGDADLVDRGILRHRVLWVREMDPSEHGRLPDSALVIERIDVRVVQSLAEQYDPARPGDDTVAPGPPGGVVVRKT